MKKQLHKAAWKLRAFCEHAFVTLSIGMAMLASGLHEIFLTVGGAEFGAHYGVAILGLTHSVKAVPLVMDSGQKLREKTEQEKPGNHRFDGPRPIHAQGFYPNCPVGRPKRIMKVIAAIMLLL